MPLSKIKEEYPIHLSVWNNDFEQLDSEISAGKFDLEKTDPRGRTPLHLAVTLGHLESARVLLRHGANANSENKGYWSVLHEATSTGDPELVQLVLKHRDHQRYTKRTVGVPELLQKLKESPDFYVEMKWEFSSWVPLVSRMCPSDTYRVYKSGSNVRIDTTLLGFDNTSWQRGSRSYVFKGSGSTATMMEIDHDQREVFSETMQLQVNPPDIESMHPPAEAIAARLTNPVVTTYLDTEKISFERNKSGIWGWRSDRTETVNGREAKVFSASNVELVTKTRMEHLTEQDKEKCKKNNKTPIESFLGVAEEHSKTHGASNGDLTTLSNNPCSITPEEYFNKLIDLGERDIGRPCDRTTKTQKFKATLWLCETYPLSLQEQVVPIIDLMAASNAHFKKLKDFITLQLPAGFPIKIEIPLFHVLTAKITFGNIFARDSPVEGVSTLEDAGYTSCTVDDYCFEPPPGYLRLGDAHHERLRDEDDELLQFAIQQSLMEGGAEDEQLTFYEALQRSRPRQARAQQEERMLQQAIAESIALQSGKPLVPEHIPEYTEREEKNDVGSSDIDEQLRLALEMSQRENQESERLRRQEEEELERILQLSLQDK
ncbi:ankyrin repeat domain-containing protein 13D-like [Mercenaria mercenaria]|uniref:ankyrin repeat domain-containing protein 13D-like n=1 Tax=Mercenaria mercenaria TaxID=6596 RepID=UPI00234F565B|nr:ankyrin repeat domain-containing protein 13D-like [Mercenaria mercenaria]